MRQSSDRLRSSVGIPLRVRRLILVNRGPEFDRGFRMNDHLKSRCHLCSVEVHYIIIWMIIFNEFSSMPSSMFSSNYVKLSEKMKITNTFAPYIYIYTYIINEIPNNSMVATGSYFNIKIAFPVIGFQLFISFRMANHTLVRRHISVERVPGISEIHIVKRAYPISLYPSIRFGWPKFRPYHYWKKKHQLIDVHFCRQALWQIAGYFYNVWSLQSRSSASIALNTRDHTDVMTKAMCNILISRRPGHQISIRCTCAWYTLYMQCTLFPTKYSAVRD